VTLNAVTRNLPLPLKRLARAILRPITILAETTSRRSTALRASHPSALQCVIASNEFGSYCVPRSSLHRPAAQAILGAKVWEAETIAFMRDNCGNGDIVHAGTYFGDFLPALASAISPGALIWAFEPNRENYRCASITIELNAIHDRVKLANAALGSAEGRVMLSVTDDSGRSLGGASHINPSGKESVAQITLEALIPRGRCISILQLDVEGYEEQALRGAEQLIRDHRPILILETVPLSNWFDNLLKDCNYHLAQQVAANSVFVAA
jgi:FkbM family methyltransferase